MAMSNRAFYRMVDAISLGFLALAVVLFAARDIQAPWLMQLTDTLFGWMR